MKKRIEMKNGGFIHLMGSNRPVKVDYATPDWAEEPQEYIRYNNMRHYLSEFMYSDMFSECKKYVRGQISGYMNYSYSSGLLLSQDNDTQDIYVYYWYTSSLG